MPKRCEIYEDALHSDCVYCDEICSYRKKGGAFFPFVIILVLILLIGGFIFLSNFTYLGKGTTMCFGTENPKGIILKNIDATQKYLENVQFANRDFKSFFEQLRERNSDDTFIYCDPPYLGTDDNYETSFTEQDSEDLFNLLMQSKCKFAVSEFDHPFILEQAQKNGLNTLIIGERQNLKNRRTEILITNYEQQPTLFS